MSHGCKYRRVRRVGSLALLFLTCFLVQEISLAAQAGARLREVTQGDPGDGDLGPQPAPAKAVALKTTYAGTEVANSGNLRTSDRQPKSVWATIWLALSQFAWSVFGR